METAIAEISDDLGLDLMIVPPREGKTETERLRRKPGYIYDNITVKMKKLINDKNSYNLSSG